MHPTGEVTDLLRAWNQGDTAALDRLLEILYPALHGLAAGLMRGERCDHTLQPTGLVHEAYLRLAHTQNLEWADRAHVLAISARLMRQVLVDHARKRGFQNRGQNAPKIPLEFDEAAVPFDLEGVLTVHLALERLADHDPWKAQVVEMRFFGGLTTGEIAEGLKISEESVNRDRRLAKAWLLRHITEGENTGG